MNTIFKKRGLAAVLLLSASVSNVIPADSANRRSPTPPPYSPAVEVLVEESIPNNPPLSSSGFQVPFPAPLEPIGEPVPVVSGSEGDQESCWSRCFGGKKSSSSECEAGSAAVSSEGSTKECCLSCNFFSKHTRDISVISAAFALICGGIALKFHRDGKSSQDFDFFGDKISAEDAEAIEEKSKSAKFKEKIFGIGAVALGVLAVLSGWKFNTQYQRIKDLKEYDELFLAGKFEAEEEGSVSESSFSGSEDLVEISRSTQEIALREGLAQLKNKQKDKQIKKQFKDFGMSEYSSRRAIKKEADVDFMRIQQLKLESELLAFRPKSEEVRLKALYEFRAAAQAERIKAEKAAQAERDKREKERQQQQSDGGASSGESSLPSPIPQELNEQSGGQNQCFLSQQVPHFTYLSASYVQPSRSSVDPSRSPAEFASSPLMPSGQALGQSQPPMASSSAETSSSTLSFLPSVVSSTSNHLRHNFQQVFHPNLAPRERFQKQGGQHPIPRPLSGEGGFEVSDGEDPLTNIPPSHFGNPQSETLPFSSMSSAPLPATTHVPSRFPSNQQIEHHSGGVAGYSTASSSSSTPIAPGCRSEEGILDHFGD